MANYGAYAYESPDARALKGITTENYDKDQAKNLSQLNQTTAYMAGYMRKMQKGIDDANQNFIQQIQGVINDVIVLLGGGTAQGLDLGDLKYVIELIGSLLGFTGGGIPLPWNALNAAWHFFSTYIVPVSGFADIINNFIDAAVGFMVDWLGDVPIVGGAVEQLAVIITSTRDGMNGVFDAIGAAFNGLPDPGGYAHNTWLTITGWLNGAFGDLINLVNSIIDAVDRVWNGLSNPGGLISGFFNNIFGIHTNAKTALTPSNPAVVSVDGRLTALENVGGGVGNGWTDNFNRSSLGPKWHTISGTAGVSGSVLGLILGGNTYAIVYTDEFFASAKQYAQMTVERMGPTGNTGIYIMVDGTGFGFTNFVGLDIDITGGSGTSHAVATLKVKANSATLGAVTTQTTQTGVAVSWGDVFGIGYDPATQIYKVYQDNVELTGLAWHDASSVIDTSSTYRAQALVSAAGLPVDETAAYDWA